MILQKIISVILVVCLLAALTTSASAVDIYSTTPEAEPLLKSPLLMSTYNGGISTAAVEPSDLSTYLSTVYKSYNRTVAELLAIIAGYLDVSDSSFVQLGDAVYSVSQLFGDLNDSLLVGITQSYLDRYGSISRSSLGLGGFIVDGIMGLAVKIDNAVTSINAVLNNGFSTVDTSVQGVTSMIRTHLAIPAGSEILWGSGSPTTVGAESSFQGVIRVGFLGLRNYMQSQFVLPQGSSMLHSNGIYQAAGTNANLYDLLRHGFAGISSNLRGSATQNIYSSTLYDNNNTSTTVNSTGIGPLLNTQLSNIGENLGHLAYVFASDEDIKLREDSQPLLDTTDSFYDDSNSNVKVSASNVGSLKDIAGNFTSIIDVDADIGDAFSIVSNSNTYRWFSADTAMNLDSVGVATVDFEESTYDRLHREFNEIYFPDRVGGAS